MEEEEEEGDVVIRSPRSVCNQAAERCAGPQPARLASSPNTHGCEALLRCTYERAQADRGRRKHAFGVPSSSPAARKRLRLVYRGGFCSLLMLSMGAFKRAPLCAQLQVAEEEDVYCHERKHRAPEHMCRHSCACLS